jgi:CDP-glucose 4,6-dehydratase
LVPDLIRAVHEDRPLIIRHPGSIRPWQHVLEPLYGYLLLAKRLLEDPERHAGAWNFGPLPTEVHTVRELADALLERLATGSWKEDTAVGKVHEAALLMLDISKAVQHLGWRPILSFNSTVRLTADWYIAAEERNVLELCREQILRFCSGEDHKG